jgi:hypothetical protein
MTFSTPWCTFSMSLAVACAPPPSVVPVATDATVPPQEIQLRDDRAFRLGMHLADSRVDGGWETTGTCTA